MKEINIYNNERFSPKEAGHYVLKLINQFKRYYSELGYEEVSSVPITSGIDSSVRFIGSHISVLKNFLLEDNVITPGVYIHQNCIRTRNVDRLLDDDFNPMWGSYFPSIGALIPPNRLEEGSYEAFNFLEKILNIHPDHILIRISSQDRDLLEIVKERFNKDKIEIDSRNLNYYRHKLGMEGISGRNFNIALRIADGSDEYFDVGNVILIETHQKELGIEIALGTTTILKELYDLDHVQDCTPVEGIETDNGALRRKLEDVIIVCSVLFGEGLKPSEQHNRNRILKKYIRALTYFRAKLKLTLPELENLILNFINTQPNINKNVAKMITGSTRSYEDNLMKKDNLAKDDEKIIKALSLAF